MKFSELKEGQRVYDVSRPYSVGTVQRVRATVAKVNFSGDVVTYDKAHVQFLSVADDGSSD